MLFLERAILIDFVMSLMAAFVLYHAIMYATNMTASAPSRLALGFLNWIGFDLATHLPL